MEIKLKRAFAPPSDNDGIRILVDRIWPRGISKENLKLDAWLKEIAPSTGLRQWFGHAPERWDEFKRQYFAELNDRTDPVEELRGKIVQGRVTLVYAAHDEEHNNALALKEYLETHSRVKQDKKSGNKWARPTEVRKAFILENNKMDAPVENMKSAKRFQAEVNGVHAFIDYDLKENTITLIHTEVPPELKGQGVGGRLVKAALYYAESQGLKVIAQCPFVAHYLSKLKEYKKLIDQ